MGPEQSDSSHPGVTITTEGEAARSAQYDGNASRGASTRRTILGLLVALAVLCVVAAVGVVLLNTDSAPGNDSPEAGLARDMQVHHAQAVEMALIVREKSQDPALRSVAYDIATSQAQQMGQMYAWLEMWGLPKISQAEPMAWMKGMDHSAMAGATSQQMALLPDGRMPGMASDADLERLQQQQGKAAEVSFLRLMIAHHEAGVMMAEAALQKTDEPVVRRLAAAIRTAQTAEIKTMRAMLTDRGA